MKKGSILLVIILILIAGIIVGLSFFFVMKVPGKKPPTSAGPRGWHTPAPAAVKPPTIESLNEIFARGIRWLMEHQLDDGAWADPMGKSDVAYTSLALIALGNAPEQYQKDYATDIDNGVKYLLDHLQENGSVIDPDKLPSFAIYKTSLAAVALATVDKEKYQEPCQKIQNYLVKAQFGPEDGDRHSGGYGYQEKGGAPTKNANLSCTEYALEALHHLDLPKNSETWKRAVEFLNKLQDSSETNKYRVTTNTGGMIYSPVESKAGEIELPDGTKVLRPYASMTYAGLLSFIYAYVDKKDPRVQAAYDWCRRNYSLEENIGLRTDVKPQGGKQGLFYYYHSFAKALDAYGEKIITTLPDNKEHFWAKDLIEKLGSLQEPEGYWVNEFEERWFEGYNLLCTCYSLMALNHCWKWVE